MYKTGQVLDSLYDAYMGPFVCGGTAGIVLPNIDGSGRISYATRYANCDGHNGILYYQGSSDVPQTGRYRKLPTGTGTPDSEVESTSTISNDNAFHLQATPNPATGIVELRWTDPTRAPTTITVTDVLGQMVTTLHAAAGSTRCQWDASRTFGGRYYITIESNRRTETVSVTIAP
jgi:hypothetical protein